MLTESCIRYRRAFLRLHHDFKNFVLRLNSTGALSKHCWRTHTCGELREEHIGSEVALCGWVEFRRPKRFLVLRDWHGHVQLLLKNKNCKDISLESVVKAKGVVQPRPPKDVNPNMETGSIEVHVDKIDILNQCESLAFPIHDFEHKSEEVRMKHRHLDIRTRKMQENLRTRSKLISSMREFLIHKHNFVEVETPTLFRPTPGGAREFIVPSGIGPDLFYSLPQSPQQFKQLLMVGGIDRYFQVARCYRDETTRPDRQPEFTQLDLEMSFVSANDIMDITESMIRSCWPSKLGTSQFPRITFKDAMEKYGTDKPDMRFKLYLTDVTDYFRTGGCISEPDIANAIVIAGEISKCPTQETLTNAYNVVHNYFTEMQTPNAIYRVLSGNLQRICGSHVDVEVLKGLFNKLRLNENDILWVCWGDYSNVKSKLGQARLSIADAFEEAGLSLRRKGEYEFLWVYDFPLFERGSDGELQCVHHPFTAPHPGDVSFLESNPTQVRSLAYDLVLNGKEVAGGSVRIHDSCFQRRILDEFLKIDCSQLEHLLEALRSGAPPHGGIAIGLDRLLAELCNANSIRDVIAFPKSAVGRDLLCGAPCKADQEAQNHFFSRTRNR